VFSGGGASGFPMAEQEVFGGGAKLIPSRAGKGFVDKVEILGFWNYLCIFVLVTIKLFGL